MHGLKERGHTVQFLGSCPMLLELSKKDGIQTTTLDIGSPPVSSWLAFSFLWRQFSMKKQLQEVLAAHSNLNAIVMLSLSEKLLLTQPALDLGLSVYWLEHDRVGRWLTHNPWLLRLRRLSRQVTTIVVSDLSKKMYLDMGWHENNITAIPNGIDEQWFQSTTQSKLNPTLIRIGCVARLTHDKGVDVLLAALAKLSDAYELHLVGQGRDQNEVATVIEQLKLNRRIRWHENVTDLREFYHSIDMLVLPSRSHDPFGLVAAEAMATGVPVIVTDACGIAGYLHDGNDALIVPRESHTALAGAIIALSDPTTHQRIAQYGKSAALELFSQKKMTDTYEKLLKEGR